MKKIIHFKYQKDQYPFAEIYDYYLDLKNYLKDYTVLLTPFDMSAEDENDVALCLNGIIYTHQELEEMLDKAHMYDDLCK